MKLIFLGTGAGKPSKCRNVSSLMLSFTASSEEVWLFDCGEATQHQMMFGSLSSYRVNRVFITHLHGDHVFGLPGLLASRSMNVKPKSLDIYEPAGIKEFLETTLRLTQTRITYELRVHEIDAGTVLQTPFVRVKALELEHRIVCFGFRVETMPKVGKLDVKRLKQDNVPVGALLQKIKNGEQVSLDDGRVIDGKNYIGPETPGKVVVILGDTTPCQNACELAYRADVLIHEATLNSSLADKAQEIGHSTAAQAAKVAKDSQVKQLIMTHLSQRYSSEEDVLQLLEEGRSVFPQTLLAYDHMVFSVP